MSSQDDELIDNNSTIKNSYEKKDGRSIALNMIKAFEACGVSKINLKAGMDVGPYFWARAGAVPEQDEWKKLKPILSKKLDDMISNKEIDSNQEAIEIVRKYLESDNPKAIWVIADSTIGNKLLYNINSYEADKKDLPDTRWYGQIDLNDTDVKTRLYAYLEKARHVDKAVAQQAQGGAAL